MVRTPQASREAGRAARKRVPRSSWAVWEPGPARRDPVQILLDQGPSRVQNLLPLRYQRMLVSPFTFYRGGAAIMAADLSLTPNSGLTCQLAGDAHLANFGGYASPERDLVFDLNDFDETLPGPFEWDLKRLAGSFAVAGRDRAFKPELRRKLLLLIGKAYREAMHEFADSTRLDIWYARLDLQKVAQDYGSEVPQASRERLAAVIQKAQRKTSARALKQMTEALDGRLQFISNPPLIKPVSELLTPDQFGQFADTLRRIFSTYRRSLQSDRRYLFDQYDYRDAAFKVVGVGSVGSRCWVCLLTVGDDDSDPLVLQLKQAEASVLEPYAGRSRATTHGQRVVNGQRMMQAASDIFLGWTSGVGIDDVQRDFYVRQLWDWKGSADFEIMDVPAFRVYAQMCGWTLARAHARTGDPEAMAAYLGTGDTMDKALADFAEAYADQNELDYAELKQAEADGRITVAPAPTT